MSSPNFATSLFNRADDADPKEGPASFAQLVALITTAGINTAHPGPAELAAYQATKGTGTATAAVEAKRAWDGRKKQSPAWSPASFVGCRAEANVLYVSCFVADLDDVPMEVVEAFIERAKALDLSFIAYATPGQLYEDERPARMRVVVPYSCPITAAEHQRVLPAALIFLGLNGSEDKSTKDACRIYFLPCHRPDGSPGWVVHQEALSLDPSNLRRRAAAAAIARDWPAPGAGNRHAAQLALAGWLAHNRVPESEALEIVCDVCREAGDEDRAKRESTIRSTYAKHSDGEWVTGRPTLADLIGGVAVDQAQQLLDFAKEVPLRRGDQVELADLLVATLGSVVADEGQQWRYVPERGLYERIERDEQSRIVQSFAGRPVSRGKDKSVPLRIGASDVAGSIQLASHRTARKDFFANAPAGIAFADCFLALTPTGLEKRPHHEGNRARAAYPFAFDEAASPAETRALLAATFEGEADAEERIAFLQEFWGGVHSRGSHALTALRGVVQRAGCHWKEHNDRNRSERDACRHDRSDPPAVVEQRVPPSTACGRASQLRQRVAGAGHRGFRGVQGDY